MEKYVHPDFQLENKAITGVYGQNAKNALLLRVKTCYQKAQRSEI